jgi:prepilin-type N-terminal cleavage/methylation domain-containing protein
MKPPIRKSAFSLIELVITLAIIGVVAAIASPRYVSSLSHYRASAAANRISADISLARSQAKVSSAGQSIVFTFSTNSYTLPGMTGLGGMGSSYTTNLASDPYNASIAGNTGGTLTISFNRFGQPSAAATVTVTAGTFSQVVSVDANTGNVTVQ